MTYSLSMVKYWTMGLERLWNKKASAELTEEAVKTRCVLVDKPSQTINLKNKSLAMMFVCNRSIEVPEIDNFQR